jgi:hypothetical protein
MVESLEWITEGFGFDVLCGQWVLHHRLGRVTAAIKPQRRFLFL